MQRTEVFFVLSRFFHTFANKHKTDAVKHTLNMPPAKLTLTKQRGVVKVWDTLRGKWVKFTPEEWVRQTFCHWMTGELGYPAARLGNEIAIEQNGMRRRCDSIFYDTEGRPAVIIEYKAPYVPLTERVLDQAIRYNMVLRVPRLFISNGMEHWSVEIDENDTPHIRRSVPEYKDL